MNVCTGGAVFCFMSYSSHESLPDNRDYSSAGWRTRDPFSGFLQRLNEPYGFSFIFPQTFQRASSLRVFGKTNDPAGGGITRPPVGGLVIPLVDSSKD